MWWRKIGADEQNLTASERSRKLSLLLSSDRFACAVPGSKAYAWKAEHTVKQESRVKFLLVANIFPPIHGGSAIVYENLATFAPPDSVHVLAPWRYYIGGQEIAGWREHDAQAAYPISRIELLRPQMAAGSSKSSLAAAYGAVSVDLPVYARVLKEVWSIVRREKVNLLCIGELASGGWIGRACQRLFGIPYISYIHGEEITTAMPFRRFGQKRRQHLHQADGIVAVSEFTSQALQDLMGVPRDRIRVINNGVDVERFTPGGPHADILARHGLSGRKVILSVGRQVPRKGFDHVIEAMPAILAECPEAHYLLVGDGDYRTELERRVRANGLQGQVSFAGSVSPADLARYYQSCDVFVMPNREMPDGDTEGFGLVFLEANACRKAVIGGRAGGAVEAVRDGKNGLLVDGRDPRQIASAVIRVLKDDGLRASLADWGLEYARASSWQVQTERFLTLCQEIVNHRAST